MPVSDIADKIGGVAIGIFMAAALLPAAFVMLAGANVTGVDPSVVTVLTVALPIVAVIAVLLYFLRA